MFTSWINKNLYNRVGIQIIDPGKYWGYVAWSAVICIVLQAIQALTIGHEFDDACIKPDDCYALMVATHHPGGPRRILLKDGGYAAFYKNLFLEEWRGSYSDALKIKALIPGSYVLDETDYLIGATYVDDGDYVIGLKGMSHLKFSGRPWLGSLEDAEKLQKLIPGSSVHMNDMGKEA